MTVQRQWVRTDLAIYLICFVASSAWVVSMAFRTGPTCDEPFYVRSGLEFWRTGSNAELLRKGTMPLPVQVCTMPVRVWEMVRGERFNTFDDFHTLLPIARMGTLVFWALLLLYAMRIGRALGGPWAGRLAVVLLAAEPNLLAHAALATTDIAVTACVLALLFHYQKNRDSSWRWRVGQTALLYAVALSAKASVLLFAPFCMGLIEFSRQRAMGRNLFDLSWVRPWFVETCQIGLLGLPLVFLYCGSGWEPEGSFVTWASSLAPGVGRDVMLTLAEGLPVFPNAGVALARQIKHNMQGHGVYLLGESWPRAVWYYFPLALTIKLTPPILLGVAATLTSRPRSWCHWLGLCCLGLLALSVTCRVQIGIRLMFPLMSLIHIGLAVALAKIAAGPPALPRRLVVLLTALGVGYSVTHWPAGLRYVNEFWGGTESGYKCLSDSNYDWGQGLTDLTEWREQNNADDLDVWYFGTDPRILAIPVRWTRVNEWKLAGWDEFRGRFRGRRLAVSLTILHGGYLLDPAHQEIIHGLRRMEPVGRTPTFLIYDFRN